MSEHMPWEASLFDWTSQTVDGQTISPNQVFNLLSAESAEEASRAYWKLDGTVCMNGLTNRAALSVVQMLLALWPCWTDVAKPYCLELLGQIGAAESSENEPGVKDQYLTELYQATWIFLQGVQFDLKENVPLYVDLLCLLALKFDEIRPRVRRYLDLALTRELPQPVVSLVRNTIAELSYD